MLLIRSLPAEATTLYVGDYSSLNYAINLANSSVGANIIDITGNITLTEVFFYLKSTLCLVAVLVS